MNTVLLRGGRRLAYLAVGPPDGALVVYLHGAIGSPQLASPHLEAVARELGIRYVMVSRPGFGGSDPLPGRTLCGFAGDLAELADDLGCERLAVVGVSAGGPYALACAHELPERVRAAAVVSCMTPGGCATAGLAPAARVGLRAVRTRPRACSIAGDALLGLARRHPRLVARVIRAGAPSADRRRLDEAGARELAAARFLAAARSGVAGMIDDYVLCTRPWGFDPADVRTPVQLWHGGEDVLVPVDAAIALAAGLPDARTAIDPGEGHFFYRRRLREVLGALARDTPLRHEIQQQRRPAEAARAQAPARDRVVVLAQAVAGGRGGQ